jgi:uncharacterized protein (DUF2062 family)
MVPMLVKLKTLMGTLLASGLTPRQLAVMLTLGVMLGILPVLWGTTLLCAGAAFLLRLNQAGIQVVNLLAYPLQLALLVPYYRLGAWLFSQPAEPSLSAGSTAMLANAGTATLKAVCAWGVTAPAAALVCYAVALPAMRVLLRRRALAEALPRAADLNELRCEEIT